MTGIFINFRVGDGQDVAALLDKQLVHEFGSARVFRSSRSIPPGSEFASALLDGVRRSSVVLVVIGPNWLNATDDQGRRRLDNREDWVRKEIAEALRTGKVVIPLLGKDVPRLLASDLPEDIADLASRQYLRLDYRTMDQDLATLVRTLIEVDPDLGVGVTDGLEDLCDWLARWRNLTDPPLPESLPVLGRDREVETIRAWLAEPPSIQAVQAPSRTEAAAFMATVVGQHHPGLRAVRVSSAAGWAHSHRLTGPLLVVLDTADVVVSMSGPLPGHVVLVDDAEHGSRNNPLVLPRLPRDKTTDAFRADGVSPADADRYAGLARRSLASLRRTLARTTATPRWAEHPVSDVAAPLVLAGRWHATSDADQAAVAEVTGQETEALDRFLTGQGGDPLVHRSGTRWQLADPHDAWSLLHHRLTAADLARWHKVAEEVLGEPDPALALPEHERPTANVLGHTRRWSSELRHGLAQGAALLGSASDVTLADGVTAGDHAAALVDTLLTNANDDPSGERWRSLADVLPLLAEASPNVFLDAVDHGLSGDQPVLRTMFTDRADQPALLGVRSPHTELLWALETLAWSPDLLPMVVAVLAELTRIDPGGSTANRPAATLLVVLQPWFPYLDITMERRVEMIRAVCRRTPDVGWRLLLDLVSGPRRHLLSSPRRPAIRTTWPVPEPPVPVTAHGFGDEVLGLALSALEESPRGWASFVDTARRMAPAQWDRVLDSLERLDPEDLGDQQFALWEVLDRVTTEHRRATRKDTALPEELLTRVDAVAAAVEPSSNPRRTAYLFGWVPTAERDVADQRRTEAVRSVMRDYGVDGLRELSTASARPELVGDVAALVRGEELADDLLPFDLTDRLAVGWAWRMAVEHGQQWSADVLQLLEKDEDLVAFLRAVPVEHGFALVGEVGESAADTYWAEVPGWPLPEGGEQEFVTRLVTHRRPWAAIDGLAMCLHDAELPNPAPALVEQALELSLEPDVDPPHQQSAYEVGQLLDYLADSGADELVIVRLELAFYHLVNHSRESDTLHRILSTNPALFVEIYCRAHPADDHGPRDGMWHVWFALRDMRHLPGLTEAGLDGDVLTGWVTRARALFAERGRGDAGDEAIGVVLSGSPAGQDGAWPAEPVRDLLDASNADHLRGGFLMGLVNNRGVTIRDGYEGGKQERALADQYTGWAERLGIGWPRVAKVLRAYADSLTRDGRQHDGDAEDTHDA